MSDLKVFASPERYVQGRGASKHLGAEMQKLGIKGPVVVVASPTPERLCGANWSQSLKEAGYEFVNVLFNGTCTAAEAQRLADEAIKTGARAMIAFGGGQVIDAGERYLCIHYILPFKMESYSPPLLFNNSPSRLQLGGRWQCL